MIVVAIIGILAAIAIPNFIKFRRRSKQSEAKSNSKAMFTAEKAFFSEKDRWSVYVGEVGFAPERNNRYAYFLGGTTQDDRSSTGTSTSSTASAIQADVFKGYANSTSFTGSCTWAGTPTIPQTNSTASDWFGGAMANIDTDSAYDTWSIGTTGRVGSGATCDASTNTSSGEPANEFNDVNR